MFASAAVASDVPSFAAAAAKSAEKFNSGGGGDYGIAFMKSAGNALAPAARSCRDSAAEIGSYHDIVFIVSVSGHIAHTVHGQGSAYGDCISSHLHMPASVAKPPTDSWPIHIRFVHGSLRGDEHPLYMVVADDAVAVAAPPPDKPVRAAGEKQNDELAKAEEPLIAKGRATYPAAKKRFLAGLPREDVFYVRKRLVDPGDGRREEVFVEVNAIKNGSIYGRIASELTVVNSFRRWQSISFTEADVLDWTILHPDGREEGNYVGKFVDTYKPE
jgi:hypothetical protein